MIRRRKKHLKRLIIEIENLYPKDDIILSYADFLKIRDYLHLYQFNPEVLKNLIKLTLNSWESDKRINRLSLLLVIKRYIQVANRIVVVDGRVFDNQKHYEFDLETRKLLYNLLKNTFEKSKYISSIQLDVVRKICNGFLINIELTEQEEIWFCSRTEESEVILNRILRYPIKSKVISNWANENFNKDKYRHRRAELISWIIDEIPDFVIDIGILSADFEYLNQLDIQALNEYHDTLKANARIESELKNLVPDLRLNTKYYQNDEGIVPRLNLQKRSFGIPTALDNTNRFPISVPDYEMVRKDFYGNIQTAQKATMIWGIAYSRHDNIKKTELLKKHYSEETFYSIFKACKRMKNAELLKWIYDQQ